MIAPLQWWLANLSAVVMSALKRSCVCELVVTTRYWTLMVVVWVGGDDVVDGALLLLEVVGIFIQGGVELCSR